MAVPNLGFLILFVLISAPFAEARHASESTSFIRAACNSSTRYPALCFRALSAYADRIGHSNRQLAAMALAVSASRTRSAARSLSRITQSSQPKPSRRDRSALHDCADTVGDGASQLGRSVVELGRATRPGEFVWRVSNVQTWVSAALTDTQTCVDGFVGRSPIKLAVRRKMDGVAQIISVALALVNRFAAGHG